MLLMAAFALGGFVLLALNEHGFLAFLKDWPRWLEAVFFSGTESVLFFFVTAYFSLRLKRLALPLAGAACFMGNMFTMSFGGALFGLRRSGEEWFVIYSLLLWGLIVPLGYAIVRRLKALAAEES